MYVLKDPSGGQICDHFNRRIWEAGRGVVWDLIRRSEVWPKWKQPGVRHKRWPGTEGKADGLFLMFQI